MSLRKTRIDIINCMKRFLNKGVNLWNFKLYTMSIELFSYYVLEDEKLLKKIKDEKPELINIFNESSQALNKSYKNKLDYYNEMTYANFYQIFEEYLYEVFLILFQNYPIYLYKNGSEKTEIDYVTLFKQNNMETLRRKIIEKRVKGFVQSNNIKNIIKKFDSIFNIKFDITDEDMGYLFLASRIRNVLAHNNGEVNNIFISDLSKEGIQADYKLNDRIKITKEDIDKIQNTVKDVSGKINDTLVDKLNQLEMYSKNNSL